MMALVSIKKSTRPPYFLPTLLEEVFDTGIQHEVAPSKGIYWKPHLDLYEAMDKFIFHAMCYLDKHRIMEDVGWGYDEIQSSKISISIMASILVKQVESDGESIVITCQTRNVSGYFGGADHKIRLRIGEDSNYPFAKDLLADWENLSQEGMAFVEKKKFEAEPEDLKHKMFDGDESSYDDDEVFT